MFSLVDKCKKSLLQLFIVGARFPFYCLLLSCTASIGALSYSQITLAKESPNFQGRQFFTSQAYSILRGNLFVSADVLPNECWISDGKCFGYFGIFPSLIRLPLLPFLPNSLLDLILYMIPIFLGILYSAKLFLLLQNKTLSQFLLTPNRLAVKIASLVLFPGNILLQLSHPRVFWEVISWSTSLTITGLYYFILWIRRGSSQSFFLSCLVFIFAANTRPNGALVAIVLGVYLLLVKRQQSTLKETLLTRIFRFLGLSLPLISCLTVYYLKFGEIMPNMYMQEIIPESSYWAEILRSNGGQTVSFKFMITNIIGYLSPAAYVLLDNFPYIAFRENFAFSFWPLPQNSIHVERHNSLLLICPIFLVACIPLAKKMAVSLVETTRTRSKIEIEYLVIVSCLISLAPTLMIAANSNRYLGDFLPLITVVFALFISEQVDREPRAQNIIAVKWKVFLLLSALGAITNLYTLLLFAKNPLSVG